MSFFDGHCCHLRHLSPTSWHICLKAMGVVCDDTSLARTGVFGITFVVVMVLGVRLCSVAVGFAQAARVVEVNGLIGARHHSGTLAFSPDGKALALPKRDDAHVEVWGLASEKVQVLVSSFSKGAAPGDRVAFSTDGRFLAVYYRSNWLTLWDLHRNKERAIAGELRGAVDL